MARWDDVDEAESDMPVAERQAFHARMAEIGEEETGRRAKVADLQYQVQRLQARIEARDVVIRRQQAQIEQLERMLKNRGQPIIVARLARA